MLEDYSLVEKIGPAEHSGLYEITNKGQIALMYRDKYGEVDDFESLIEQPSADNPGDQVAMARGSDEDEGEE